MHIRVHTYGLMLCRTPYYYTKSRKTNMHAMHLHAMFSYVENSLPSQIKRVAKEDHSQSCSYGDRERFEHRHVDWAPQVQDPRFSIVAYATIQNSLHIINTFGKA